MNLRFFKRSLPICLALLFALSLLPLASIAAPDYDLTGYTIILHTNDTHGRIDDNMGFAAVAALKELYADAGADVLVFDAGDTLHGNPVLNLTKGENAVRLLNAVGYDAMVPGNHDFNYGDARLKALAGMLNFDLLAANVKKNGASFAKGNIIIDRGGVKYGVFGLSTPETAYKTNPKLIKGITFAEPVSTAKAQVAELKKKGADVIIALCHIGLEGEYTTEKLAKSVPGIDIIIDGHSHSRLEEGLTVGNTLIASTGEYIESVGVVTIAPDGSKSASLISGEYTFHAVDRLVADMLDETGRLLDVVIGNAEYALDGERENVRQRETNLGNLIADALRDLTGADLAMENGGGIRATIPAGDITKAQVLDVLPFANYVVTVKITGAQILAMLEHGVKDLPELSGGFPQVSGVEFTVDPGKPAGSRVSSVLIGGKALDQAKSYTLATNDFTAAGGDGYDMLAAAQLIGEYPNLEEVVMDFITKNPGVKNYAPALESRRIKIGASEAAETGEAGDEPGNAAAASGEYTVKKGDNLWSIALDLYGDSSKWPEIYMLNRDLIHKAHIIRTGMTIKVP